MDYKNSFHFYAGVTIFFWSLAYALTRLTLQHFSTSSLGFLRYLIASCALVVISLFIKTRFPDKRDLGWFVLSGAMGFFVYMIAFNEGQAVVTAATGSIVIAVVPVVTALIACFLYREKLHFVQWIAICVAFSGVAVLMLLDGDISVNAGLVWLLFATLALSIYNLLQRQLTKRYSALQVSTYSIFCGTALLAIFAPVSMRELYCAPAEQYCYLVVLGVCSSAIAYVAWAKALSLARQTSQVSNYMFVTPLLTSILGYVLAGEVPGRGIFVGGGIILFGLLLFNAGGALGGILCPKGQRTGTKPTEKRADL